MGWALDHVCAVGTLGMLSDRKLPCSQGDCPKDLFFKPGCGSKCLQLVRSQTMTSCKKH